MQNRQVGLGAVLALQYRNATSPSDTAAARTRPAGRHHPQRHGVIDLKMSRKATARCRQVASITSDCQAVRARKARIQTAIDTRHLAERPPKRIM